MNKKNLAEIAGWYGMLASFVAYLLVSFKTIDPDGMLFQMLNLTGALGIIAISLYKRVIQSVILNIFWAIASGILLIGIIT